MNEFKGDIGGHKISVNDLEWNGNSTKEQLKNIIRSLVGTDIENKIVLYGCLINKVGTDYTNTAGAIYYNGEIYTVDAMLTALSSATPPKWFVDITYGVDNPVMYKDGTPHNVHHIRKLKLVEGAGTGEFTYNDGSIKKLSDLIKADNKANKEQEAWHYVGAPGEPAFQNSWSNATASGGGTLRFMKDDLGFVHLEGVIGGGGTVGTIFSFPLKYRPDRRVTPPAMIANFGHAMLYIYADGRVQIERYTSGGTNAGVYINATFKAE